MAQQQRRDEFANVPRTRDRDVHKNDESDRWRDEYGTRVATDPVAPYAYGTTGAAGYGAPAVPSGTYGMTDYGTTVGGTYDTAGYDTTTGTAGYDTTTGTAGYGATGATTGTAGYGTTGATTGYGTAGVGAGQWGRDATTGHGGAGGGDSGRDRNRDMNNMNKGRDQK